MKIIIDNNIFDKEEGIYLSEGKEGESYRFSSLVVKVLNEYPQKLCLTEEDILRLKNIETEVLDHPIASAKTLDDKYVGPVSSYVSSSGYNDLSKITSLQLSSMIDKMYSDGEKYALKRYMIGDLQYADSILDKDGNLHLVDSGSYQYKPNLNFEYLKKENSREIDEYLIEELIDNLLVKKKVSKKKCKKIKEDLRTKALDYENVGQMLKEELANYDIFDEYISNLKR